MAIADTNSIEEYQIYNYRIRLRPLNMLFSV